MPSVSPSLSLFFLLASTPLTSSHLLSSSSSSSSSSPYQIPLLPHHHHKHPPCFAARFGGLKLRGGLDEVPNLDNVDDGKLPCICLVSPEEKWRRHSTLQAWFAAERIEPLRHRSPSSPRRMAQESRTQTRSGRHSDESRLADLSKTLEKTQEEALDELAKLSKARKSPSQPLALEISILTLLCVCPRERTFRADRESFCLQGIGDQLEGMLKMDHEERRIFEERGVPVPPHLQDLQELPTENKEGQGEAAARSRRRERRRRQRMRRKLRDQQGLGGAGELGQVREDFFEDDVGLGCDDSPEESERKVEDYFDPVLDPDDSRESQEGELRGYMIRQPLNAPHYIRSGMKRYNENWFHLRDEIAQKPGRVDIEELEEEKKDEVTRLLGYDELPEDVEYKLHGKTVSRDEYKRYFKRMKKEGLATDVRAPLKRIIIGTLRG